MNTFLYACIILFPGKLSAVFIILIESMNKINCFLGHCFTFFLGRLCKYPLSLLQFSCRWNYIPWNSKVFRAILLWPRIRNQSQYLQFFCIWSNDLFLLHSSMQSVKLLKFILSITVIYWRWFFNFYMRNIYSRNVLLVHI